MEDITINKLQGRASLFRFTSQDFKLLLLLPSFWKGTVWRWVSFVVGLVLSFVKQTNLLPTLMTQKHKHVWVQRALNVLLHCDFNCLIYMLFYFFIFLFFGDNTGSAGTGSSFHNRINYKYSTETDVPGRSPQTADLQTDRFAEKEKCCVWESFFNRVSLACKHADGGL